MMGCCADGGDDLQLTGAQFGKRSSPISTARLGNRVNPEN